MGSLCLRQRQRRPLRRAPNCNLASSDNRRTRRVTLSDSLTHLARRAHGQTKPPCSTFSLCSTTGFSAAYDPPCCCLLLRPVSNCCGVSRRPETVAIRCALLRSAADCLAGENCRPGYGPTTEIRKLESASCNGARCCAGHPLEQRWTSSAARHAFQNLRLRNSKVPLVPP